jgi:hypothetical protein
MISKVKVKVKLSLCLTKHHDMKTCGGVEVHLRAFLTSELEVGGRLHDPAALLPASIA